MRDGAMDRFVHGFCGAGPVVPQQPRACGCGMWDATRMALATAVSARHSRLKTLYSARAHATRVASRFIDIVSRVAGRENDRGWLGFPCLLELFMCEGAYVRALVPHRFRV